LSASAITGEMLMKGAIRVGWSVRLETNLF
jgi:hypothetical protein